MALSRDHAVPVPLGNELHPGRAVPLLVADVEEKQRHARLTLGHGAGDHVGRDAGAAAKVLLTRERIAVPLATGDRARAHDVAAAAGLGSYSAPPGAIERRLRDEALLLLDRRVIEGEPVGGHGWMHGAHEGHRGVAVRQDTQHLAVRPDHRGYIAPEAA